MGNKKSKAEAPRAEVAPSSTGAADSSAQNPSRALDQGAGEQLSGAGRGNGGDGAVSEVQRLSAALRARLEMGDGQESTAVEGTFAEELLRSHVLARMARQRLLPGIHDGRVFPDELAPTLLLLSAGGADGNKGGNSGGQVPAEAKQQAAKEKLVALLLHVAGSQSQVGYLDRPALAAFLSCAMDEAGEGEEGDGGDAAAGALIELAGGEKGDSSVRAAPLAAALALASREADADLSRPLSVDLSALLR